MTQVLHRRDDDADRDEEAHERRSSGGGDGRWHPSLQGGREGTSWSGSTPSALVLAAPSGTRTVSPVSPATRVRDGEATQPGTVTWSAAIQRATCSRESTPSLLKMLARWLSTVRSEMNRLPATWALVAPSATSEATSISRRESGPPCREGSVTAGRGCMTTISWA